METYFFNFNLVAFTWQMDFFVVEKIQTENGKIVTTTLSVRFLWVSHPHIQSISGHDVFLHR